MCTAAVAATSLAVAAVNGQSITSHWNVARENSRGGAVALLGVVVKHDGGECG
jgi:hypothetical protein